MADSANNRSKRKRTDLPDGNGSAQLNDKPNGQKRPKSSRILRIKQADYANGIITSPATLEPQLLADRLAQQNAKFAQDLTDLELEETRIPVEPIVNTTEWEQERSTKNIADFLRHFASKRQNSSALSKPGTGRGSPHTIVVAMSGLRAADLTRELRVFQTKDTNVAKLFAKHIKLKDAIEHAQKTRMSIGVGTPSRIIDLLESGALKSDHLERFVIDSTHLDAKKRSILDMKETQRPLMKLLTRAKFKERYGSSSQSIDLLFY